MSVARFARALLVTACLLLAIPAIASAATYTVNSIGDQEDQSPGTGGCETSVGNCTLRAAIQESNASSSVDDTIVFSPLFNGESLGTITPATELPTITDAVAIDGTCTKGGGATGPCVGLVGGGTILAVQAADVTIEGLAMTPGGGYGTGTGISVLSGSPRFKAAGNWIGTSLSGSQLLFLTGVNVNSAGIVAAADAAEFSGDSVAALGVGVSLAGPGAVVRNCTILSGLVGMALEGDNGSLGSRIEDSKITGNVESAMVIRNADNRVLGNEIINQLSYGGIYIENAGGNVIGGDLPSEENVFSSEHTNAITIKTDEATQNEVAGNRGAAAGQFIKLESNGSGNPNGGIQPPSIGMAFESSARGNDAVPGAKVRVYAKETEGAGEIKSFLGVATADSSGVWRVIFTTKVPAGTIVAATQTNPLGGTSELWLSTTAEADPACPSADAVGCEQPPPVCATVGASDCQPPVPPDTTPPKVTIKKGPKAKSTNTTAKFVFKSNESGSKFRCKLDNKAFANCKSPTTYKKLKPGKHVFKVKATDAAGNVSKVVSRKFTVLQ